MASWKELDLRISMWYGNFTKTQKPRGKIPSYWHFYNNIGYPTGQASKSLTFFIVSTDAADHADRRGHRTFPRAQALTLPNLSAEISVILAGNEQSLSSADVAAQYPPINNEDGTKALQWFMAEHSSIPQDLQPKSSLDLFWKVTDQHRHVHIFLGHVTPRMLRFSWFGWKQPSSNNFDSQSCYTRGISTTFSDLVRLSSGIGCRALSLLRELGKTNDFYTEMTRHAIESLTEDAVNPA
jgi:hypothetical protein